MKTNAVIHPPSRSAEPDIHAIKAPVKIFTPELLLFWLIALAAAAAIAILIWKRGTRPKPAAALAPSLSPFEKARQTLERALALIHDPNPFCTLISDALRLYLEERFDVHAVERTTEEFDYEIQASPFLSSEHKRLLAEFLTRCDLVKFARHEPTQDQLHDLHRLAFRLLQETHPPPMAPPQHALPSSRPEISST